MFCNQCGSQIPDDSLFCSECGAPLPPAVEMTAVRHREPATESAADVSESTGVPNDADQPTEITLVRGTPAAAGVASGAAALSDPDQATAAGSTGTQFGAAGPAGPGGPSGPSGPPPARPPQRPDRTPLWVALGIVGVIIVTAAIALPLILTGKDGDDAVTSTTESVTTTQLMTTSLTETTVTTAPPTTTPPTTAAPTTTAPPTTAAPTTTTTGLPGDSAGEWHEVAVPGGPWTANGVAVSDEALLLQTSSGGGSALYAVMFTSGEVIELAEAQALWHFDIDGRVAVWWEGNAWSDAESRYTDQHIYTYRLPDGPQTEIVGGGRMTLAQIALPWVTWAEYEPWVDDPDEYNSYRIIAQRVNENGERVGTPREYVSQALAFMLGDSGWYYTVSNLYLAWENALDIPGSNAGMHVLELDTDAHGFISADAWRPSLWEDVLVYTDTGLKYTYLSAGGHHSIDSGGQYPTAGPTFAAYYRSAGAGSEIVARGYSGSHEQILGSNPDPPWWCPDIAVSAHRIAFVVGTEVHLFQWGG